MIQRFLIRGSYNILFNNEDNLLQYATNSILKAIYAI